MFHGFSYPFFRKKWPSPQHGRMELRKTMERLGKWLDTAMGHDSFQVTKRPEDKLEEVYNMFLSRNYKFGGLNRN